MKNIKNLSSNNRYIFEINNLEFKKINYIINKLNNKYLKTINNLYIEESYISNEYDFLKLRLLINKQKEVVINIINDVINYYNNELSDI